MQVKICLTPKAVKDFVSVTSKCDFDIDIASNNRYIVDAKSIVGILGLDMTKPLTVTYRGYDPELENFIKANAPAC